MKYDYKYKGLAENVKEILQENFPKNKDLTDVKSALLDDDDFIYTIRQENPLIFSGWDELP